MRRLDPMEQLREGLVGQFAPATDPVTDRLLPGFVKLDEDAIVVKLVADVDAFDNTGLPIDARAVAGRTEAGDILLLEICSRGRRSGSLDVAHYSANAVIVNLDLRQVDHDAVTSVQLAYHGLFDWLPEQIYKDDTLIEDGQYVGWMAELRYGKGITVPLDKGFELRFSAGWNIGGEFDRRTFATPLTITVQSEVRRRIHEHLVRLDAVHALLNIAHRERVMAFRGSAKLTPASDWGEFWESTLMSADAAGAVTQEFPYFGLIETGGVEAVANWIAIVLTHRRAVAPVIRHVLEPNQTPESRLLSTAAAMESWVVGHRRTHDWAKKVKDEHLPAAIVRRVDRSWDAWVGDSVGWLEMFWSSYNHVKHHPGDDLDARLAHVLETSGRWLLTAALLDEAAGNNEPSRHLFEKSLGILGEDIRAALEEAR